MNLSGFVKFRRGLLEHVTDGRLSVWEYATYTFVLALADHRTGCWHGDGRILSQIMKCSWRQSRLNLQSLIKKNYLIKLESPRRGSYTLYIDKYFLMASPCHQVSPHGMTVPPRRHDHATLLQEENKQIQEAQPKPLRVFPRSVSEAKAKSEAMVGAAPIGGRVRPEILERIAGRRK